MGLIELINTEAAGKRRSLLVYGVLTGVANMAVMASANAAATSPESPDLRLLAILVLAILLFILCYRRGSQETTRIFEDTLHRIKLRVTNKIRRVELQGLERIGTSEIYDRITENMTVISDSANVASNFMRSVFMVVFGAIYMIYLSPPAFVLASILFGVCITMYLWGNIEVRVYLVRAAQKRMAFFERLTDLLQGFKEVKFSMQRSDELQEDITVVAAEMRSSTLTANTLLDKNTLIPTVNIFILLGAIAFVLPQYVAVDTKTVSSILALTMFIFGPIGGLVVSAPMVLRANLALENVYKLEQKLDDKAYAPAVKREDPWGGRFATIEATDVEFSYPGEEEGESFHIGPVSLTIPAGEVLYIVGGNGSGKSTLLKVLTGLYPASHGQIEVDDAVLKPSNVQAYREMIATVFADFHLFKKLYGLASVKGEEVRRLLAQMRLDRKTSVVNRRFTAVNLSTGQRKRLALIVALLEDRPIYAFDEWAADQDPDFRRYFYEELIPDLKRRGKTVLVVTHDDRYFHCADRVAVMELGKLRSILVNEAPPALAGAPTEGATSKEGSDEGA